MSKFQQTKGIVLRAFPFKENDRIVTLYTPTQGILKLVLKCGKKLSLTKNCLATPFTVGEYVYTEGKGELCRFHDGTIEKQFFGLRDSLEAMLSAKAILDAIFFSQLPGKASPQLYELLLLFLEKIAEDKEARLLPFFLLKVLKFEGVLHLEENGMTLGDPLSFSPQEKEKVALLFNSRSFEEVLQVPFDESFSKKVELLFKQLTT